MGKAKRGLMVRQRIAITFDVDMVDYMGHHSNVDELEESFPAIQRILLDFPQVRTNWFIRIDSQISSIYGRPDFVLRRHANILDWLRIHGHQVGWHHHAYRFYGGSWSQETRVEIATREIRRFGEIANRHGMSASRMGWGWHTNESIQVLDEIGFVVDSSCIPRPCYPWEANVRDWSRAPSWPYRPSRIDYQTPGEPSLQLLQIPMSTTHIPAPGDSEEVRRYINLAYRPEVFARALSNLEKRELVVTITHPYELLQNSHKHSLIAFDMEVLRNNLTQLASIDAEFVTMEDEAQRYFLGAGHQEKGRTVDVGIKAAPGSDCGVV